ncbi:PA3496 family putative envelope integrity protein [Cobetia marina]
MTLGADEHQARKKQSAVRHLRARRGIEMHNEIKRLSEDLSDIEVLETESDIDTH